MAYNRGERFSSLPKYYRFLGPTTYQHECSPPTCSHRNQLIKAPFLSKAARSTSLGNPIWTHAYYKVRPKKIVPNCTSMKSKTPRFPYETFSEKDLEDILCRCGLESICECPTGLEHENKSETKVPLICQRNRRTQLYKGSVPQPITGLGTKRRPVKFRIDPPFYDTRVKESTAFYHGCKWSKRTAESKPKVKDSFPGPTHYDIRNINLCGKRDSCAEQIQFIRKKYSRQLRYIEKITEQHILENRPGPASYNPKQPKCRELLFLGSRSVRFPISKLQKQPGPADYTLKRDFDPVDCKHFEPCHAKLCEPPCFGSNGPRFKYRIRTGPGPADYRTNNKICSVVHCNKAPFGSTVSRFNKEKVLQNSNFDAITPIDCKVSEYMNSVECPKPTWIFRSKINRFKALLKDPYSPSPADNPQTKKKPPPPKKQQQIAPFLSSELRFNQWFNWIPIHQRLRTPGPCYYEAEKAKCYPAVHHGPLSRTCRFKYHIKDVPAPNAYEIGGGIKTILKTFNKNLSDNIKSKQNQFPQEVKPIPRIYNFRERELQLLLKCLSILDYGEELFTEKTDLVTPEPKEQKDENVVKEKMLRYFLYEHYIPRQV